MAEEWRVLVFNDNEYTPETAFEQLQKLVVPQGFEP